MALSKYGVGRSLPAGGRDKQVPMINTTSTNVSDDQDVEWRDNGARTVVRTAVDYTAAHGDIVLVDTTVAGRSITLPSPSLNAVGFPRSVITVKRQAGANTVTVVGAIDGGTNASVTTTSKTFATDGTEWVTLN